jgi:hypothetical protein
MRSAWAQGEGSVGAVGVLAVGRPSVNMSKMLMIKLFNHHPHHKKREEMFKFFYFSLFGFIFQSTICE